MITNDKNIKRKQSQKRTRGPRSGAGAAVCGQGSPAPYALSIYLSTVSRLSI